MKAIVREDDSGVSEVVGTILILGMTVVLFASIILWVGSIPAPTVQSRVDIRPSMYPMYDGRGVEIGVNITLLHRGVDSLNPASTVIYVTWARGTNPAQTDKVILRRYEPLPGNRSGILDGRDTVWDIGERWAYENYFLRSSDQITVLVVDIVKNTVLWTSALAADPGNRPPIIVSKWTDDTQGTPAIDPVQATRGFFLYARVFDQDNDLNKNSVWAAITIMFGTGDSCAVPQQLHDNGVYPDAIAGDDVFTLGGISCMSPPFPALSWDGSIILLNATDMKGHQTKTRLVMRVVEPFTQGEIQTIPTELWQYIGFIQIRAGEVWVSNLNDPYSTTRTFQPFRVTATQLNGNGGSLFHFQMSNHGNRTIFLDGWTAAVLSSANRASVSGMYIVKAVNASRPANAGGIAAYPGSSTIPTNFQYAQVFDINPLNQEKGGTPVTILAAAKNAFASDWPLTYRAESLFLNILVSGMAGPLNMTYQQILSRWGPTYNPYDHLLDLDPSTKTQWYAQVIPFIGMVVY